MRNQKLIRPKQNNLLADLLGSDFYQIIVG